MAAGVGGLEEGPWLSVGTGESEVPESEPAVVGVVAGERRVGVEDGERGSAGVCDCAVGSIDLQTAVGEVSLA